MFGRRSATCLRKKIGDYAAQRWTPIRRAAVWAEADDAYADIRHQLVTNNVRHYERIPGLALANWSES